VLKMTRPIAIRLAVWLIAGAVSGVTAFAGEPLTFLLGVLLFLTASLVTATRRTPLALPTYLIGAGLAGVTAALAISPEAAYSVGTSGHSAICSSAGGCVGGTTTQSAFAVPALAVFAALLLLGLIWFGWNTRRRRTSRPHRGGVSRARWNLR
jgi:hypothetical protein